MMKINQLCGVITRNVHNSWYEPYYNTINGLMEVIECLDG